MRHLGEFVVKVLWSGLPLDKSNPSSGDVSAGTLGLFEKFESAAFVVAECLLPERCS